MAFSRRDFVKTSVLGAVAAGVGTLAQGEELAAQQHESQSSSYKRPIIIAAHNGFNYIEDPYTFLKNGGDTLDAALRVVKTIPRTRVSAWVDCRTRKVSSSWTPVACTGRRGVQDQSVACATSRMCRWWPRP